MGVSGRGCRGGQGSAQGSLALCALHLPPRVIGETPDADLRRLGALLRAWRLEPSGSEGYAKAEVTLGGVDTAALSQQTLAAKHLVNARQASVKTIGGIKNGRIGIRRLRKRWRGYPSNQQPGRYKDHKSIKRHASRLPIKIFAMHNSD
jgi:hypothetical protein